MFNNIRFYFFTDNLNETIINNINKFKNIAIIYKTIDPNNISKEKIEIIKKFCKKKKVYFLISDNIRLAKKYDADGFFISSLNKKIFHFYNFKKNFFIIGSAHNIFEYNLKIKQQCKSIMLSPIFYNKKYTYSKILGVIKFNLISKQWKTNICALGGINFKNLNKIKMTRANSVAFISLMNETKNKKARPLFLVNGLFKS